MGKTKKALTNAEIFNAIVSRLQRKDMIPEILEYAIPESTVTDIKTDEFTLCSHLDWGASEGIYLDVWLEIDDEDQTRIKVGLGTFKTLHDGQLAMRIMARLLADFIFELDRFKAENRSAFEFTGYRVTAYKDGGIAVKPTIWYLNKEMAEQEAEKSLKKYPVVSVTELATDTVKYYKADEDGSETVQQ